MRLLLLFFILSYFVNSQLQAKTFISENRGEISEIKASSPSTRPDKCKANEKKRSNVSKRKAIRKLRFTKPFMFLNPLISHLLFLTPSQISRDTLGA